MRPILFAFVALVCVPAFAAEKIVQKNIQRRGLFGRNVDVSVTKVRGGNGDAQLNAALKAQAIRNARLKAQLKAQQLRNGHHSQNFRQQQNFHGHVQRLRVEYVPVAAIVEDHSCASEQLSECATYSPPAQQLNGGCNLLGH